MGATPSLLQLQVYPENIGAEFGSEGAELEEVSKLPSEEVEVSEQPLEGVSGEVLGWKEHMVVLGLLEGAWSRKHFEAFLELGGGQSPKNAEGVQGWSWENSKMLSEWKRGHPLTGSLE